MTAKRKRSTPQPGDAPAAKHAGTVRLLPMEIRIGDRFTEGEHEWEVVTHPSAFQGGKSLRARIRRFGVPESETEMTWPAAQDALRTAGDLDGKILLDCTNPLKPDLSDLTVGHTSSGAEQVAAWAADARRQDLQHDGVLQYGER